MRSLSLYLIAGAAVALGGAPAFANGSASAGLQEMRDWNLIVLGNANSSSEVEGNAFIGGDLGGGSSNYYTKPNGAPTPGLVVGGNVTSQIHVNNGGGAQIGGNETGSVDLNGAQALVIGGSAQNINGSAGSSITVGSGSVGGYFNQNGASFGSSLPANFASSLQAQGAQYGQDLGALSQYLAGLTKTDSYTISPSNQINFSPAGPGNVAVFDLTDTSVLSGIANIDVSTNGFDTIIVNVGGTSDAIPSGTNFAGGSSGLGQHVIWNFYDATSLGLNGAFYGSVLAPKAAGVTSNFIEGSAVFASLTQNGEVHMNTYRGGFTPGVPEPSTWAVMLLGVCGIGAMARVARRRQAASAA